MLRRFARQPRCVFFDSAQKLSDLGRYSFLAADPFDWIASDADDPSGLDAVDRALARFSGEELSPTAEGLPPFQGGAAGLLGYEIGRSIERLPRPRFDEFQIPTVAIGLYDVVVAFDHYERRAWIISQGLPETEPATRRERAQRRLQQALGWLAEPVKAEAAVPAKSLDISQLAPQYPTPHGTSVTSDFTRDGYLQAVQRAVEYVHAGDIFQVNLSQRLLQPATASPVETYLALRQRNPAPFAGYFDLGESQVCSASPERFLLVRGRQVETRPIKGTRRRSSDPADDRRLAEQLVGHHKDRAENVMIVDLMRNDLSRVCTDASIDVPELCRLESYVHVHHLTSVVTGRLNADESLVDLLRATLPGGSITGAPKIRSMQIIAELEPTARGPYCGSLMYAGFNGAMDSSILIRTLVASHGWIQASVGGGIVADSDPAAEYEETWHKARGMLEIPGA